MKCKECGHELKENKNKTIKIKELNIEVEIEYHQKDVSPKDIIIPKGWRLLTLNEFFVCYNKYSDKFKDLNNKTDEYVLQPIENIKQKFPYCNLWFDSVDNGSNLYLGNRDLSYSNRALGVRFCKEIK